MAGWTWRKFAMAVAMGIVPLAHSQSPSVAFIDVNLMPMQSDGVTAHQTVLVRDGHIVEIGPVTGVAIADGTQSLNGRQLSRSWPR